MSTINSAGSTTDILNQASLQLQVNQNLSDQIKIGLHLALGQAYRDIRNYDAAVTSFESAIVLANENGENTNKGLAIANAYLGFMLIEYDSFN